VICEHCVPVGLSLNHHGESTKVISAQVLCHLPPNSSIIYDHSCGLKSATINLNAKHGFQTSFHIDKFHGTNHLCSPAFKCDFAINSSASEQLNASLHKFETILYNSRQDTALAIILAYLIEYAQLKNTKV